MTFFGGIECVCSVSTRLLFFKKEVHDKSCLLKKSGDEKKRSGLYRAKPLRVASSNACHRKLSGFRLIRPNQRDCNLPLFLCSSDFFFPRVKTLLKAFSRFYCTFYSVLALGFRRGTKESEKFFIVGKDD